MCPQFLRICKYNIFDLYTASLNRHFGAFLLVEQCWRIAPLSFWAFFACEAVRE